MFWLLEQELNTEPEESSAQVKWSQTACLFGSFRPNYVTDPCGLLWTSSMSLSLFPRKDHLSGNPLTRVQHAQTKLLEHIVRIQELYLHLLGKWQVATHHSHIYHHHHIGRGTFSREGISGYYMIEPVEFGSMTTFSGQRKVKEEEEMCALKHPHHPSLLHHSANNGGSAVLYSMFCDCVMDP